MIIKIELDLSVQESLGMIDALEREYSNGEAARRHVAMIANELMRQNQKKAAVTAATVTAAEAD